MDIKDDTYFFSMTAHYTCVDVSDNAHIGVTLTSSTDGDSLEVLLSDVINQFSLGSKIVHIPSDGGPNLARCKAISESTFDNMGVFDLGIPLFVID